jgi:serine/threonine protein kinase
MVLEKLTPSYAGEDAANLYSESFCRKSSPSIETAEVFAGLCTGISAAVKHIRSLAVSHSDIKLRNTGFVLHDNGSLTFKLIDFGSARKLLTGDTFFLAKTDMQKNRGWIRTEYLRDYDIHDKF